MNTCGLGWGAWFLFAVWSAVGTVVVVGEWQVPGGGWADFVFLLLGAVVVGQAAAAVWGVRRATLAFGWVAVVSGLIETVGTLTGWPFGTYTYTDALGPRLGVLPLAIPLAWWVVLVPLWVWSRRCLGGEGRLAMAARVTVVAVGAVLVDLVLEPVAWSLRGYWLWSGGGWWFGVPAQNFAGWAGTAALLVLGLEFRKLPPDRASRGLRRTAWVLATVVGIFGLTLLRQGGAYLAPGALGLGLAAVLVWAGAGRSDPRDRDRQRPEATGRDVQKET